MFVVDSPWTEIILLAARIAGFGAVLGSCCRSILSPAGLCAVLVAMEIAFLPVVSSAPVDLGSLAIAAGGVHGTPIMMPLALQFTVGLILGIPAAGVVLSACLCARWANALVEPGLRTSDRTRQRSLEHGLLLLCFLSMAPFFSNFFRFFAEGFLGFPFAARDLVLPGALWQLASAAGQMAFASALLFLIPSFVLLFGFGFCLLLFQRLFPALLSDSATRAALIPCLLLTLAFGMYRTSLAWTEGVEQSLRSDELRKIEQLGGEAVHGK